MSVSTRVPEGRSFRVRALLLWLAFFALLVSAASGSQSSSLRRSQWLSVADQPVALDIARAQQRSDQKSFLLVRSTSGQPLSIRQVAVKVSTTETLRSAARDSPPLECSELQRTARGGADQQTEKEQAVWRCDLGQELMARMLDGSGSRLEFLLASGDGLEQAVTVEVGWLRRRRLATLR